MQLQNRTRFPANIFRSVIHLEERRFAAALVARVTFDLTPGGPKVSEEQPWIISPGPWKTEHGPMDGDEVFRRGGVDVFVFGSAQAPGGQPVTELEVAIEVGPSFRRAAIVTGDRTWVKRGGGLSPSSPKTFTSIPLTLANAYGGRDRWDGLDVTFPDNPEGKGYAVDEKGAEGRALPNIEDPKQRVRHWEDRPEPVGFGVCPMTCGLRMRNGLVIEENDIKELKPVLFNSAFPSMIASKVAPGDVVRAIGVSAAGPLELRVPSLELTARLRFGAEVIERPLQIDQLGLEPDRNRIFVTYRYPFRYVMYPLQKRSCELVIREPGTATAPAPVPAARAAGGRA